MRYFMCKINNIFIRNNITFFLTLVLIEYLVLRRYGLFFIPINILYLFNRKRINSFLIFNKCTKTLSMNMPIPPKIKYFENKDKIKKYIQKSVIEGILSIDTDIINFTTHEWILENCIFSQDIKNAFDIEVIYKNQYTSLELEILSFLSYKEYKNNKPKINQILKLKRKLYHVKLKKINPKL